MGILKDRIDDIQPSDKKAEEVPEQDVMTEEDAEIIDDLKISCRKSIWNAICATGAE